MTRILLPFIFIILLASCSSSRIPKHELRGAWIATVVNIDWPKHGEDDLEKKKQDYLDILDFYEELHFNAAIVQVRTAGDAFYPSSYAPWSKYLTGQQGTADADYEALLHWMIKATHDRGMEFHAWMNPYRATFDLDTTALSKDHDYFKHPEWMIRYGTKYYYNPALPEVQQHLTDITNELVENYNIDAIHFDDYFYPYKIKGEVFADSSSFDKFKLPEQSLSDWRRANVDSLISRLHAGIKSRKPWVQFGISPFGVWRNKSQDPRGSDTKAGQTNYDDLYADPLSWLKNGWIDYLAPQIYWTMDHKLASHRTILQWWDKQVGNTNLYVGNGAYRVMSDKDPDWQDKNQLIEQVNLGRRASQVDGNIYFSAKSLMKDKEEVVSLLKETYAYPSLTPPVGGAGEVPVIESAVAAATADDLLEVSIRLSTPSPAKEVVVYELRKPNRNKARKAKNIRTVIPLYSLNGEASFVLPKGYAEKLIFSVTDRYGRESALQSIDL